MEALTEKGYKFLQGFKPTTTVYVFEKENDNIRFITSKRVDELKMILLKDYKKNCLFCEFENYINKQLLNGFTFYAKRYDQLNVDEKNRVELVDTLKETINLIKMLIN